MSRIYFFIFDTPSKPVDNIDDYIQRVYNETIVLSAGLPDNLIEEKA